MPKKRWASKGGLLARLALAVAGGALVVALVLACGPDFPDRLLTSGDAALLAPPVADFLRGLLALRPGGSEPFAAVPPAADDSGRKQTAAAEAADLEGALVARGDPPSMRERLIREVRQLRFRIEERRGSEGMSGSEPPKVPAGLPPEVDDYLRGAVAVAWGDDDEAESRFRRLLERPPEERRLRSTWAAYSLARLREEQDRDEAIRLLGEVRRMAEEGFPDPLGLAAASWGEEGRLELDGGRVGEAIDLYLHQKWSGDATADNSLRMCARRALELPPDRLADLARRVSARRVVTFWVLAHGADPGDGIDGGTIRKWLGAVERAKPTTVDDAEAIGWLAYQAGDFAAAKRWLALADSRAPLATWLRAKLALRDGDLDEGYRLLGEAVRALPAEETWTSWESWQVEPPRGESGPEPARWEGRMKPAAVARGELGVLALVRGHFLEALDALRRGGYWDDAAYVAEQLLSVEELRAYVDSLPPARSVDPPVTRRELWKLLEVGQSASGELDSALLDSFRFDAEGARIRRLLARRLVRLDRLAEARSYFPPRIRQQVDSFAAAKAASREPGRSAEERGRSLFEAAKILRHHGMELSGTELEPDWAVDDGDYEQLSIASLRRKGSPGRIAGSSIEERRRLARQRDPVARRRWHYRFRAARLAARAAELLPDDSEETASVLAVGGSWIKYLEPKEAIPFHRALVRRCPRTSLGLEAIRTRWLPRVGDFEP
jgi:tetratricopeptide (TPR) repeat protein